MNFKAWAQEKKVKENDLIFMRSLKSQVHLDLFPKVADAVCALNPSFSEGLQLLELLTDLILMGHTEDLVITLPDLGTYKKHFKALRYPRTTKRDDELKTKLESLPWPYGSKIKFERRGDRAGIELKLFISSEVDLTKVMAALERVQKEISQ